VVSRRVAYPARRATVTGHHLKMYRAFFHVTCLVITLRQL
jgi:hypothetical protein